MKLTTHARERLEGRDLRQYKSLLEGMDYTPSSGEDWLIVRLPKVVKSEDGSNGDMIVFSVHPDWSTGEGVVVTVMYRNRSQGTKGHPYHIIG